MIKLKSLAATTLGAALFAGLAVAAEPPLPPLPFDLGGAFELTDHTGTTRSEADPEGHPQLVFFGYANCPSICAVAMPVMATVVDELARDGLTVRPVMITVDPERDTVESMGPALAEIHPEFVGLTGDEAALDHVYGLFNVTKELIFVDIEHGPIYAHGSHIYLLDGAGEVMTLLPPILSEERVVEIVQSYIKDKG